MTDIAVPGCIVVTGASAGIGQALALAYAAPGVVLGLIGRDAERLEASAQACRARGAEVVTGCIDIREAEALKTWLYTFDTAHPIDLLIANAGTSSILTNASDWEDLACTAKVIDVNLYGTLHTVLPVIERMRLRKHGQIALVASLLALRGIAISPAYCVSKAAIKVWADSVRPLLKRDQIALSVILPGFVKTAMSDNYPYAKPSMWSVDRAAAYIRRKLAARRAEIAFPFLLQLGMRLASMLPTPLADLILNKSHADGLNLPSASLKTRGRSRYCGINAGSTSRTP
jgi:short-subunit dehydrogenase